MKFFMIGCTATLKLSIYFTRNNLVFGRNAVSADEQAQFRRLDISGEGYFVSISAKHLIPLLIFFQDKLDWYGVRCLVFQQSVEKNSVRGNEWPKVCNKRSVVYGAPKAKIFGTPLFFSYILMIYLESSEL